MCCTCCLLRMPTPPTILIRVHTSLRLHHDDLKVPEYLARTAIKMGMYRFVMVRC